MGRGPQWKPSARDGRTAVFLLLVAGGAGCDQGSALGGARRSVAWGDPEQGHALIRAYGCGTCHTIAGIPGADQHVGPPLTGMAERTYIAGVLYNTTGNLIRWIMDPQEVEPGNAMPDLGISESEARNIVAYLYSKN